MSEKLIVMGIMAFIILLAAGLIVFIISKLYRRSTKELSFVRTGFGGQKVIMDGGAIVLPVFHEIIPVNMNTLLLEVRRHNEQALITKDRMRVDVSAEFYLRVKPEKDSIAAAAQTLGTKTTRQNELKELIEGKFVDALRSVAAGMDMKELHEQRVDFVQKVQNAVSDDLFKNGLELESVSLTGLDQTSKEYFNPDNAFDAEGLTKLTEEVESRRKRRNEIEQDTTVAIETKNMEAERQNLTIRRDKEFARLEQEKEIETRRAEQTADIEKQQALRKQEAEQAEISAKQAVESSRIESEQAIAERNLDKDRSVKEKDIQSRRAVEQADIEKKKAIEIAEQDREIAVAEKSKEKSAAQAEAEKARAMAVQEEERVTTVREAEKADRAKKVELIRAAQQAEAEAIEIKVEAEAEREAAKDKAAAVKIEAEARASQITIAASADAEATRLKAEAEELRYTVEAQGRKLLNEAANLLSPEQVAMQIRLALIEQLPAIIEQSVAPMEHIDSIKIVQVDGLGNSNGCTAEGGKAGLSDQVVNSALKYRSQAPLVDSLLKEVGLKSGGTDLSGLSDING